MNNPYVPYLATIKEIRDEVGGSRPIKTLKVVFNDNEIRNNFKFKSGQCAMLSVFGIGECMISISSSPSKKDYLEFSIMHMGKVTKALHNLDKGDEIGVRGPYGNYFPIDKWKGKNLIFIGGGIGQAPLRSLYNFAIDNRKDYGEILIIYGARTSCDLVFLNEIEELEKRDDVDIRLCIDWKFDIEEGKLISAEKGWKAINSEKPECTLDEDSLCTRFTCFVSELVLVTSPFPKNTIAITCGPPKMIEFVIGNLLKLGFKSNQIFTTLEMRMKCGIGKCGRCNIGNLYVCKDGPVFSYDQLKGLQGER